MKILKNAGTYEILTPVEELREQLLRIEKAGRTCYQSETGPITPKTARKFVRMLIRRGHESVLEHSNMTVRFSNCSRGFTHELVRHRIASFSQESTRYVDYARSGESKPDLEQFQLHYVVPPHRDEFEGVELGDGRRMSIVDMFSEIEGFYRALRQAGWPPQDARQVLPIGIRSQIVVSANFREWHHIFKLRTARTAHWEIRKVMCELLNSVQRILPAVFGDFVEAGLDTNGLRYFEHRPPSG